MSQTTTIGNHKTRINKEENKIKVKYWDTNVVTFDDNEIVLNTGGWKSMTTKLRMNQTSNQFNLGFRVSQSKGVWYVSYNNQTTEFENDIFTIKRA